MILMVAITVVLAATVYVWVSGFGSQSGQASKSISLTQATSGSNVVYTVSGATPGMRWADLKFVTSGVSTAHQMLLTDGDVSPHGTSVSWTPTSTETVSAGDQIYLMNGATSAISSVKLTILDVNANSVMLNHDGGKANAGSGTDPTSGTASRNSGTAGVFTAGVTRVTLNQPIDMSSLAVADLAPDNGHVMGSSTLTVRSPTEFDINWGTSTVASGDTITIAIGALNDQTGAATAGAATISITAAV